MQAEIVLPRAKSIQGVAPHVALQRCQLQWRSIERLEGSRIHAFPAGQGVVVDPLADTGNDIRTPLVARSQGRLAFVADERERQGGAAEEQGVDRPVLEDMAR